MTDAPPALPHFELRNALIAMARQGGRVALMSTKDGVATIAIGFVIGVHTHHVLLESGRGTTTLRLDAITGAERVGASPPKRTP